MATMMIRRKARALLLYHGCPGSNICCRFFL